MVPQLQSHGKGKGK
jgi:hypothetical protein